LAFREKLARTRDRNDSNVILALDVIDQNPKRQLKKAKSILNRTSPNICGVKINRQLILSCGLDAVSRHIVKLSRKHHMPTIMDAKINDVGHTNEFIASAYFRAGFDAVIASPFVGWREGLEPVFRLARRMKRGVILLVYMSHRDAKEGFGRTILEVGKKRAMFELFAERARQWHADGVIVGATYPEIIRKVRRIVGQEIPILAPGVGAQGGSICEAMDSGADYLIAGRTIIDSKDPALAAKQIAMETSTDLPLRFHSSTGHRSRV
jgi:orotidine-5'-phosphate decarboxylase